MCPAGSREAVGSLVTNKTGNNPFNRCRLCLHEPTLRLLLLRYRETIEIVSDMFGPL